MPDNKKKSAETAPAATSAAPARDYTERRWMKPSKRAKGYAEERKEKVHKFGPKEGQELTEYEKGLRSGYLLCRSDSAGAYIYGQAIKDGKTKEEAAKLSRTKGQHRKNNAA